MYLNSLVCAITNEHFGRTGERNITHINKMDGTPCVKRDFFGTELDESFKRRVINRLRNKNMHLTISVERCHHCGQDYANSFVYTKLNV